MWMCATCDCRPAPALLRATACTREARVPDFTELRAASRVQRGRSSKPKGGTMKHAHQIRAWAIPMLLVSYGCTDEPPLPDEVTATTQALGDIDSKDKVDQYALGCYDELGVKPADLEPVGGFDCKAGTRLSTTWTHNNIASSLKVEDVAVTWPDGSARMAGESPAMCDSPVWLSSNCNGAQAYASKLNTKNADVDAVLLCRHKSTWNNDDATFDDVAIVMHNKKSGKTCWFQALGAHDRMVPPPTKVAANAYFLTPQATAGIDCYSCHDNGPWMNSPWIFQGGVVPPDKHQKYSSPGAAFAAWPAMKSVTVGTRGLPPGTRSCVSCHAISTKDSGPATYDRWFDRVIGRAHSNKTSPHGKTWPVAGWMPSRDWPGDHGYATEVAFKDVYDHVPGAIDTRPSYVDAIKACMAAPGAGGDCKDAPRRVAMANPAFSATVVASILIPGGGGFTQSTSAAFGNFSPIVIPAAPQPLTVKFDWEARSWNGTIADGGCSLEWTFPSSYAPQPGVTVELSEQGSRTFTLIPPPPNTPAMDERRKYSLGFICDDDNIASHAQIDIYFAPYPETKICPNPLDPYDPECPCTEPGDPRGCVPGCTSDADCPVGSTCDAGVCTPTGCTDDTECPFGMFCDAGTCTTGCTDDTQCPGGFCNAGVCGVCTDNRQCPGGFCNAGICGGCTDDTQCPGGFCNAGICGGCTSDWQCPGGFCNEGTCGGCTSDWQCPGGFCDAGTCGGCTSDWQCPGGFCNEGTCGGCTSDSQCPGGTCNAGTCTVGDGCPPGQEVVCGPGPGPGPGSGSAAAVACRCQIAF
jgi:Cys-rich repeat protein